MVEEINEDIVTITGWKGAGELTLSERKDVYILREYRKNKETKEIYTDETEILKSTVKELWNLIRKNCVMGEEYKYRYLVRKVIESGKMDLAKVLPEFTDVDSFIREKADDKILNKWLDFVTHLSIETFNGGKFRKEIYFPFYYSLKILEGKGYIAFLGKGSIIPLQDGELE